MNTTNKECDRCIIDSKQAAIQMLNGYVVEAHTPSTYNPEIRFFWLTKDYDVGFQLKGANHSMSIGQFIDLHKNYFNIFLQ